MQTYDELVEKLPKIKDMGYVLTHRAGNTGIGKTLEDLLNIKENNIAGPNGYQTELKSSRKGTNSMLTLITKSPLPRGINRQLVEKFGKPTTTENGQNILHTTIDAVSRNSLFGKPGFIVGIYDTRIEINHDDYGEDMRTPYWDQSTLKDTFYRKYPKNLLYVKADCKGRGKHEEFHYNEAWLLSGFVFTKFTNLLKNGKIKIDIRLGQHPNGRLHDHGTGFRAKPEYLDQCFEKRTQIL